LANDLVVASGVPPMNRSPIIAARTAL